MKLPTSISALTGLVFRISLLLFTCNAESNEISDQYSTNAYQPGRTLWGRYEEFGALPVVQVTPNYIASNLMEFKNYSLTFLFAINWKDPKNKLVNVTDILKQVAVNNKVHGGKWEIWLLLYPRDNLAIDLDATVTITAMINRIYNQTITTILMDYGLLRLSSGTLPVFKQDIGICNRKANIVNLRCGLIIDSMNCVTSLELIAQLGLQPGNVFIVSNDLTSFKASAIYIQNNVPCFWSMQGSGILLGYRIDTRFPDNDTVPIEDVRTDKETIKYSRNNQSRLYNQVNKIKVDVKIYNVLDKTQKFTQWRMYNPIKNDRVWLDRNTDYDKTLLGVSVYSGDSFIHETSSTLKTLLNQFRKIFLETGDMDGEEITDFVQKLCLSAKHTIPTKNPQEPDVTVNPELFLVMNVFYQNLMSNKYVLDEFISAANEGNKIYPGIVTTILLNWVVGHKDYGDYFYDYDQVLDPQTIFFLEHAKALHKLLAYATTQDKMKIRLGVLWEILPIDNIIKQGKPPSLSSLYTQKFIDYLTFQKSQVSTFILKVTFSTADVLWKNLRYWTRSIIFYLNSYVNIIRGPPDKSFRPVRIGVYIGLMNCTHEHIADLKEMRQLFLFWEIIYTWAVKNDILLILNTAYETPRTEKNLSSCTLEYQKTGRMNCMCGWWHVINNTDVSNSSDMPDELIVNDIKSIARRLIDEAELKPPRNEQTTDKKSKKESLEITIILLTTGVVLFCVSIVVFTVYKVHKYRLKNVLSKREVHNFLLGGRSSATTGTIQNGNLNAHNTRYDNFNYLIGEGEYSKVYKGRINRADGSTDVAVKIKSDRLSGGNQRHGNILALKGLISEVKILSFIGDHPNIVKLEAAYTAKLRKGVLIVFLELCPMGSLDKYLRSFGTHEILDIHSGNSGNQETSFIVFDKNKPEHSNHNNQDELDDVFPLPGELTHDLSKWSQEIICGMQYLTTKKLVHADLATRNVLLDAEKVAKICDFGLSRRLYDYTEYVKLEQASLPWRRMAPESIRKLFFNERSDVWSFGVTLWEMYTLGDLPYSGLSYDVNFPALLTGGVRLPKPKYASNRLYEVMKKCWALCPEERPNFGELQTMLKVME